jgi:hypothetical protein
MYTLIFQVVLPFGPKLSLHFQLFMYAALQANQVFLDLITFIARVCNVYKNGASHFTIFSIRLVLLTT